MVDRANTLIVIENERLCTYDLDNRGVWTVGRVSRDNIPDISFHTTTVSRKHGSFQNVDGMWFYLDKSGKNGTVYNGKRIMPGLRGRIKPVTLRDGDILIFGGNDHAVINHMTVWTLFSKKRYDENWRIENTKGVKSIRFVTGEKSLLYNRLEKGMVVDAVCGQAIYMGDTTFLNGNIELIYR